MLAFLLLRRYDEGNYRSKRVITGREVVFHQRFPEFWELFVCTGFGHSSSTGLSKLIAEIRLYCSFCR